MNNSKLINSMEDMMDKDIPNIFVAAENNDVEALEISLQHFDVNTKDAAGMTPLHYAASTLSFKTVDRLLQEPNIDATIADVYGRSAASLAYECWLKMSDEMVTKLVPHCYPWLENNEPEHSL